MLQERTRLCPRRGEIDQTAMAAHPSRLTAGPGRHWLMMAAEMAGLVSGDMRPTPDPVALGRTQTPRIATHLLGADPGSIHAARSFTVATLHRWGAAERSSDITLVVSELLTNALRHAGSGDTGPRPVWLGLLQPGPCVLCAVADPSKAAPTPQTPGSLAETGRGLHIIYALSDQWGYTTPSETGKVVWALFHSRLRSPSPARYPHRQGRDQLQDLAARQDQPA
jgi:anti-sigma regulatory factor (Ser/Thr protein kinase)